MPRSPRGERWKRWSRPHHLPWPIGIAGSVAAGIAGVGEEAAAGRAVDVGPTVGHGVAMAFRTGVDGGRGTGVASAARGARDRPVGLGGAAGARAGREASGGSSGSVSATPTVGVGDSGPPAVTSITRPSFGRALSAGCRPSCWGPQPQSTSRTSPSVDLVTRAITGAPGRCSATPGQRKVGTTRAGLPRPSSIGRVDDLHRRPRRQRRPNTAELLPPGIEQVDRPARMAYPGRAVTPASRARGRLGRWLQYRLTFAEAGPDAAAVRRVALTYLDARGRSSGRAGPDVPGPAMGSKAFLGRVITREGWGADESIRFVDGEDRWPRAFVPPKLPVVDHTYGCDARAAAPQGPEHSP